MTETNREENHMNTIDLPAGSIIELGGALWTRTVGNQWRAQVWASGDTDLSLSEMAGLPGVVVRVGA